MSYETVLGKKVRISGIAGKKSYSYGNATAYVAKYPLGWYIELATRRKLATTQPQRYRTKNAAISAAKKMVVRRG
jgi:hypothetical protein